GTFQPLPRDNPMAHAVEAEWGRVPAETLAAIAACRARGGRVVAVGTTCTRLLESMEPTTELSDWEGWAKLTVRPGHEFRHVDAMVTNFHQPGTGLLLLMNSFASTALLKRAYTEAIAAGYRFLSYGDATLVL
ncbi:MAG: S-adenosylmethionine:tRNA ribosyltransferase-isomerase, partial [Gemmataceae bacterium]